MMTKGGLTYLIILTMWYTSLNNAKKILDKVAGLCLDFILGIYCNCFYMADIELLFSIKIYYKNKSKNSFVIYNTK